MSSGTPMPPPPPPPGGYGAPPPPPGGGYGPPPPYGTPGAAPQNGMGIAALISGILGILCILPFIGSILGIIFGVIGSKKAKQGLATNGGMAKAGLWLGIIGLVLAVLSVVLMAVLGVGLFKAAEASLDPANNSRTGLADGSYEMDPAAHVSINERCSFTGTAADVETGQTAGSVTIVGVGPTQCGVGTGTPSLVTFTVSGGTAVITSVER